MARFDHPAGPLRHHDRRRARVEPPPALVEPLPAHDKQQVGVSRMAGSECRAVDRGTVAQTDRVSKLKLSHARVFTDEQDVISSGKLSRVSQRDAPVSGWTALVITIPVR